MVCLKNISVDILHKGDSEDDYDDDYNNNNNNNREKKSRQARLAEQVKGTEDRKGVYTVLRRDPRKRDHFEDTAHGRIILKWILTLILLTWRIG
jgi:hypothetical protein